MKKLVSLVLTALILCLALVGCGSKAGVTTDGSTSMETVIGALGEAFQKDTGIQFAYSPTGSSSGT